jgi:phosphatidate cytidylyltransferase
MPGTELGRRVAVAAVGVPLGVAIIYLGVWPVAVIMSVVAAVGAWEVFRIAEASGWRPFRWLGIPAAVLLVASAGWSGGTAMWSGWAGGITLALALLGLAAAVFWRGPAGHPLPAVASTLLGAVYIGGTLGFAVRLRAFPGMSGEGAGWEGALVLIFPMTVAWIGDTAAYFAGHRWGRRKLIPSVSPGKTVAGGIGGLVGALVTAVLFAALLLKPYSGLIVSPLSAAAIGAIVGAVAQIGDLAESLLKREAGVKDSGGLFPGHGGVLDRFDSILFALPVAYVLLTVLRVR